MSVHTLKRQANSEEHKGKLLNIQSGWDTPCSWYYMVVMDGDEILYSNLNDSKCLAFQQLSYFVELLKDRFGIEMPAKMIDDIENDRNQSRMSHYKEH
ncbi:hypothetical protein A3715_10280 [Oleiphilus sp. HI0009]|nr:hypothetical protein A3715_20635 [Oleiphilus sp. HI0009]KZX78245.1 hypothetical protein A3715_10280 [Oleiphilus sp. HI0009]